MSSVFQSWQNQNRYRAYPFRDDVSLSPVKDPGLVLPDDFIIDFAIALPLADTPGVASPSVASVKLSAMLYSHPMLTLFFSNGAGELVATASTQSLDTHVPGTAYTVSGAGDYTDAAGSVVIGDLDNLKAKFPAGSYTFGNALFEISTVRPALRGVRSIRTGTGLTTTDPMYGVIKLVEGANVKLTYYKDDEDKNVIRFDAINSSGFSEECDCAADGRQVLRTVNGLDAQSLFIVGDSCVDVSTGNGVIRVTDKCSTPCCGCTEMNFIEERLRYLETMLSRLEEFSNTLATAIPSAVSALAVAKAMHGEVDEDTIELKHGEGS